MADPVAAVILAAGASRRLGQPKQLLALDGKPLLQHVIDAALAAGVGRVIVVLGHEAEAVRAVLDLPTGVDVVVNERHAEGQATSLAAGVAALDGRVQRALVLLGDEPEVAPAAIRAVLGESGTITRARYRQGPGHPVAFDRSVWPELLALTGDVGARHVVARDVERVVDVALDLDRPGDVDTDADAARLGAAG